MSKFDTNFTGIHCCPIRVSVAYNAPAEIIIICLSINEYLIVILVSMFAVRIS